MPRLGSYSLRRCFLPSPVATRNGPSAIGARANTRSRRMRRRDRRGTAEDVQRPAAFLSREELAEKMHAINLKTSAATITASNFYLDDPKEMIARTSEEQITRMISSSGRPQTAPAVAKPSPSEPAAPTDAAPPPVDPFVAMARQLGVELRSPQQLMERRLVQERSRYAQRQQILLAQIEDALTPRKGPPAGSPGTYMQRAMHGR